MAQPSTKVTCWPFSSVVASGPVLGCCGLHIDVTAFGTAAVGSMAPVTTSCALYTTFCHNVTMSTTFGALPPIIVWVSRPPGGHLIHLVGQFINLGCGGHCSCRVSGLTTAEINVHHESHMHSFCEGGGRSHIRASRSLGRRQST